RIAREIQLGVVARFLTATLCACACVRVKASEREERWFVVPLRVSHEQAVARPGQSQPLRRVLCLLVTLFVGVDKRGREIVIVDRRLGAGVTEPELSGNGKVKGVAPPPVDRQITVLASTSTGDSEHEPGTSSQDSGVSVSFHAEDEKERENPDLRLRLLRAPHVNMEGEQRSAREYCKYGELVILGYNGSLSQGDKGRRRSKFILLKKAIPNGVKKSHGYVVNMGENPQAVVNKEQHSISYTMSRNQTVVVEYMHDSKTDMFQIGRSSESGIDFVVMDTIPGDRRREIRMTPSQSTISRFACRFIVPRDDEFHVPRLFAAGFDSSNNIFLGSSLLVSQEKATKWQKEDETDGLTTNGVLIYHPVGSFLGGDAVPGMWAEVSVGGGVYGLRESRSSSRMGCKREEVTNELRDGSMIDLCGATLLWRSAEGLKRSPTKQDLESLVDKVNAGRPQCPVGLTTLVLPRRSTASSNKDQQPYVYLNCGHVQGHHEWRAGKHSQERTCPMCFEVGPIAKLEMGLEPAFYVDCRPPTYAFNPCGHMASEKTIKYWEKVPIPHGTNGFHAMCPFCATPLEGSPGYVKLIFQDNLD
ncbi:unnamed protein product, partial [Darwinula stevensoni]